MARRDKPQPEPEQDERRGPVEIALVGDLTDNEADMTDRLLGIECDCAASIELHTVVRAGGTVSMTNTFPLDEMEKDESFLIPCDVTNKKAIACNLSTVPKSEVRRGSSASARADAAPGRPAPAGR